MKHPWMKFYPSDWQSDQALGMCSLAARGLWVELLALMHKAEPYGHLKINGKVPTIQQIAILARCSATEAETLLNDLVSGGVCDLIDGVVVSRRMVRDAEKSEQDKANGRRGGNPRLNPEDKPTLEQGDKAQIPDTRYQKLESKKKIIWQGKTIRLTQSDWDSWSKAYPNLDLTAELQSLDDYYTAEKVDKWFARCSGALAKKQAQKADEMREKTGAMVDDMKLKLQGKKRVFGKDAEAAAVERGWTLQRPPASLIVDANWQPRKQA